MVSGLGKSPPLRLVELLARALLDEGLRNKVFGDPEVLRREWGFSIEETDAIKKVDRKKFERAALRLRWG
jgi:hypothetical protein